MIRENLRFHLWPFESFRLLLLDGTKLAFQLFRSNFLCRNMRNISLLKSIKIELNRSYFFFVSFFSVHDLISFSNFVIKQRRSESERAREREREKRGISRAPESLRKKKKKRRGKFHAQRESRIRRHKRESKICGISKDRILGQNTGILASPSANKRRNDVMLL